MFRRKNLFQLLIVTFVIMTFNGCQFMGDVLRTGFYSGIFLVVLIVVMIIFTIVTLSKRK